MSNGGRLILNCSGGLGNQMFEYAAGKLFARRFNRVLEVVKPPTNKQQAHGFKRPFQLDAFRISATPRETTLLDRVFFSGNPIVQRWHGIFGPMFDAQAIQELSAYWYRPEIDFDQDKKNAYLNGYWQAAAYVEAVERELREEFQLRSEMQERNRAYADRIAELECPISVHVRIGDYALIEHMAGEGRKKRVSNVLAPRYYERALVKVRELFSNRTLVVFSDEPERARKLFEGLEHCMFVEGNDELHAHEDMWLMSRCRHHVIANSSFSWWGAWLGHNPEKRVFAPRYWGNTPDSHFPDLCSKEWTIVDNL
jgi:hypothetical protein